MPATSRNFWPLGLIITFALFFIGMACVVVIAATHRDHLVNANYYEQELKFQSQSDGAARARNAGATVQCVADGKIIIALPVAQLARQFSGKVTLYRANDPALDREFSLAPDAAGTQTLDVSQLAAGPWSVRVAWLAGGQDYFLEEKIVVPVK